MRWSDHMTAGALLVAASAIGEKCAKGYKRLLAGDNKKYRDKHNYKLQGTGNLRNTAITIHAGHSCREAKSYAKAFLRP